MLRLDGDRHSLLLVLEVELEVVASTALLQHHVTGHQHTLLRGHLCPPHFGLRGLAVLRDLDHTSLLRRAGMLTQQMCHLGLDLEGPRGFRQSETHSLVPLLRLQDLT